MLILTPTGTNMNGSFTGSGANGYLVLRRLSTASATAPIDGTTYTVGTDYASQRVVASGASTSFTDTGLAQFTGYTYSVYAFNGSGGFVNYLTTTPLTGAQTSLPVELSSFTARQENGRVALNWTTASEKNNAGFQIQRTEYGVKENGTRNTENGENWKVLGFVKGNGTTTESQSYSFIDKTASGKVSYRLKQIDFDGQFEILPTVEVEVSLPKQFALDQNYPNPFNPSTVISYQLPVSGQVSLKVYDLLGREVATLVNQRQDAGRYQATFNAASLSSGVYFYRLQAGTFVQTNKMLLVK